MQPRHHIPPCLMLAVLVVMVCVAPARSATIGPPMLDIAHQCSLNSRRNVAAMSECIVAESEARAEILQKWQKVPDTNADRCVKLGRKNQKYPYTTIAKCLAGGLDTPARPAAASR